MLNRIKGGGACLKHRDRAYAANQLYVGQLVGGPVEWSSECPGMSGH